MKRMYIFFSSRRRQTRFKCDWSSDVCSSDLPAVLLPKRLLYVTVVVAAPFEETPPPLPWIEAQSICALAVPVVVTAYPTTPVMSVLLTLSEAELIVTPLLANSSLPLLNTLSAASMLMTLQSDAVASVGQASGMKIE